jgi:hypothetical protein
MGSLHVASQRADPASIVSFTYAVSTIERGLAQMSGRYGLRQASHKMVKDVSELLDTLFRHPSTMIAVCVSAFLLFIDETLGTAQELFTGTMADRASMERSGLGGISARVTAQNGQATASPGQWLIDDVARERAEFDLRQVSRKPLSATNAARDAAHVEAGVGLPSDGIRAGEAVRRAEGVINSIGTPTAEGGGLGAGPSRRALKRSNGTSPRPDTSGGLIDSATKCIEAPVGAAPEGEYWYYRLDREIHRKCWYVRAIKEDRAQGSIVESDRRQSEPTLPAFLWWPWR